MKYLLSLILIGIILSPFSGMAQAATDSRGFNIDQDFDPNIILMDTDVFTTDGMSFSQLVSFMRSKGTLADYRTKDIDGETRTAPEIIWRIAHMFQISPKYLLALLQKEQSLVEDPNPSERQFDWAMGFGVCDSCSKDDPSIQDFKGFANQVYYAARQMREKYYMRLLMEGETISGYAIGRPVEIDGIVVTPANYVTAALYTYTPHIHGNLNLWRIWRRWFTKNFPDGSVVRGIPSNEIYWIRYGVKRPFASLAVANSLVDLSRTMDVSDSELAGYESGTIIRFPNYALLKDETGKIWLLVGNERRHIVNMETFRSFGFNIDEVENANTDELSSYVIGEKITPEAMFPQGQLVKVNGHPGVWYAESGSKHLLTHPGYLTHSFPGQKPKIITTEQLDALDVGEPYRLENGELVKASDAPAVYVIEHGYKRPIPSADIFESMGWKWSSIKGVPSSLLDEYPVGATILLDAPPAQLATAGE